EKLVVFTNVLVDGEEAGSSRVVFLEAQNEIESAVLRGNAKQRFEDCLILVSFLVLSLVGGT
uniref:Uncharacterized protein n=1 Tax=Anopheles atroparvus TaxID=41427 RepID=A0AAG5DPZ7_ANOAO